MPSKRNAALILAVGLLVQLGTASSAASGGGKSGGEAAGKIAGKTLSGDDVTLGSLLDGKEYLVVSFWGVNCLPCIKELGLLGKAWAKAGVREKARMIAVNTDGFGADRLKDEMGRRNIEVSFPVVPDESGEITDAYVNGIIPLTVLIGKDRTIRGSYYGANPDDVGRIETTILGGEGDKGR